MGRTPTASIGPRAPTRFVIRLIEAAGAGRGHARPGEDASLRGLRGVGSGPRVRRRSTSNRGTRTIIVCLLSYSAGDGRFGLRKGGVGELVQFVVGVVVVDRRANQIRQAAGRQVEAGVIDEGHADVDTVVGELLLDLGWASSSRERSRSSKRPKHWDLAIRSFDLLI